MNRRHLLRLLVTAPAAAIAAVRAAAVAPRTFDASEFLSPVVPGMVDEPYVDTIEWGSLGQPQTFSVTYAPVLQHFNCRCSIRGYRIEGDELTILGTVEEIKRIDLE